MVSSLHRSGSCWWWDGKRCNRSRTVCTKPLENPAHFLLDLDLISPRRESQDGTREFYGDGWNMRRETVKSRWRETTCACNKPFHVLESCACVTRMRSVRSTQWPRCRRKNVRATGECAYTPVANTVVATTSVRTSLLNAYESLRQKKHHSMTIFRPYPQSRFFWSLPPGLGPLVCLPPIVRCMSECFSVSRGMLFFCLYVEFWIWGVPVHRELSFPTLVSWDGVMHVWLRNPVAHSWVHLFWSVRNEILQSLNPRQWEREYRSCVNLHREKWLHIQLTGTNVWLPKMHWIPLSHCGTSTFENHNYCLIVLKDKQHSTITWMGLCMFGLTTADGFFRSSSLGASVQFGTERNTSITKSQTVRAGIRSCVNLHREKWFQLLQNCMKRKFVSYTSNLLAQTCDFGKCTKSYLRLILSLQSLLQKQSWNKS